MLLVVHFICVMALLLLYNNFLSVED